MPRSLVIAVPGFLCCLLSLQPQSGQDAQSRYASPLAVAVDADGRYAYVALHGRGTVAHVDLQAGKVLGEVPVDAGPYDIAASADTLYVTCSDGDSLVLIDRGKFTVRKRVAIGQAPRGLYVNAERQRVYVACHDEQAVRCFHETTGQIQTAPLRAFPDRIAGAAKVKALLVLARRGGEAVHLTLTMDDQPQVAASLTLTNGSNARGLASPNVLPGIVIAHQRPGLAGRLVQQLVRCLMAATAESRLHRP